MKLINSTIRKWKFAPVIIFSFALLLNFCGISSLALSSECGPHHDSAEAAHSQSDEETHSEDATSSHEDEEDSFCCSTIKAVSITSKQNLTFDFLRNFLDFFNNSAVLVVAEISQLSEIWNSFHYLDPPGTDRFKIVFLITSPAHAPPILYTI